MKMFTKSPLIVAIVRHLNSYITVKLNGTLRLKY